MPSALALTTRLRIGATAAATIVVVGLLHAPVLPVAVGILLVHGWRLWRTRESG